MQHRARKRFGQNFLQDNTMIGRIIESLQLRPEDKVVEIGPGLGALTKPMLQRLSHLTAIEIDRDLLAFWGQQPEALTHQLQLIGQDALTVDYAVLGPALRLVGNLPYNVATPLLAKWGECASALQDIHVMLQREVAQRIVAAPGSKTYGRLSVLMQYHFEVTLLLDVPPEAFSPAPKVHSAFIRLKPHPKMLYAEISVPLFSRVLQQAFGMRRKTLANNLKPWISAEELTNLGINPLDRPEVLSVQDYVFLTQTFMQNGRYDYGVS
ncbi:MAG: 16S rRNA (adenine(1518)-N(6)/adenine(1519)-N(6))-dimethyltransferase RsmA [Legionellaceae bacterium]|nr:16S rRNA (adenine(1518)-N(6)/adenine(1519)-N(6))-dimethyltransferase RsmA [Legionellaceae bacterium]